MVDYWWTFGGLVVVADVGSFSARNLSTARFVECRIIDLVA